jgi:hypothetical protein
MLVQTGVSSTAHTRLAALIAARIRELRAYLMLL